MVTCTFQGGLGNTMFQAAACYGYAKKWDMPYVLPYKGSKHIWPLAKYKMDSEFNFPVYKEPYFHYTEIPYSKDINLLGYFQSVKYFEGYEEDIRRLFSLPIDETKKESICIHVRRGDYLGLSDYHCSPSISYLEEAVSYFRNEGYKHFFVVSDDIPFCKNYFSDKELFSISQGVSAFEDMSASASCAGMIGSASTFSWWIDFLQKGENRKSVFPIKWFGLKMSHDTKDIYNKKWILF